MKIQVTCWTHSNIYYTHKTHISSSQYQNDNTKMTIPKWQYQNDKANKNNWIQGNNLHNLGTQKMPNLPIIRYTGLSTSNLYHLTYLPTHSHTHSNINCVHSLIHSPILAQLIHLPQHSLNHPKQYTSIPLQYKEL